MFGQSTALADEARGQEKTQMVLYARNMINCLVYIYILYIY